MLMVCVGHTSTQALQAMQRFLITVWVLASLSVLMADVGQVRSHRRQKMHLLMSHITRPRFPSGRSARPLG